MSKGIKIFAVYAFVMFIGAFLYMSARWYSYRTPHVERKTYEKTIERSDPILKRFKNKPKEGLIYFQSIEVTTTDSAGSFPFLADTKYDTVITTWSRPSWNEYK